MYVVDPPPPSQKTKMFTSLKRLIILLSINFIDIVFPYWLGPPPPLIYCTSKSRIDYSTGGNMSMSKHGVLS